MPNNDLVEIVLVLDRSGSMASIRDDMEGGFKTFIEEQKKAPGQAVVSLYQFDGQFETCFEEKPLAEVTGLGLVPRGNTALHDAVGQSINLVGARLAKKDEAARPGGVVVLVITDGQENASKGFTQREVLKMVEHQSARYKWQFLYLGSDLSTAKDAANIGMISSCYTKSAAGTRNLMTRSSQGVASYRASRSRGLDAKLEVEPEQK